ncbi:hypothetical protein HYFRA_00009915 [Hymenoscyphus fraxineus]|uniref:Uncharacterized protein n=1 Tax=Hymenoscyphus fraxineus TaxID=746836 RepID=A0A9N9PX85_9HELO|nr:hypothetical protein HYFRA_00009915 [Hymenoscyphus fraxineus]
MLQCSTIRGPSLAFAGRIGNLGRGAKHVEVAIFDATRSRPFAGTVNEAGASVTMQTVVKVKDEAGNEPPPYNLIYNYPTVEAAKLPPQELFLLQHLSSFTPEVQFIDNKYSSWMRQVPSMIGDHRFLLDVVLGVSAAHHNLSVGGTDSGQLALYYRGRGLKGLQDALGNFSESNADAVLASSIILTWYSTEWKEWSSLTHGIHAIQSTMQPYADRSHFVTLIEEQAIVPPELQPLPPTSEHSAEPNRNDIEALDELISRLGEVKIYVEGHEEELSLLDKILDFALMLKAKVPMTNTDEQYSSSRLLRVALVTIPVNLIRRVRRDALSIFFGHLALAPLTELGRYLEDQRNDPIAARKYDWNAAAKHMLYPAETVRRFRRKMGWPASPEPLIPLPYNSPDSSPESPTSNT